MAAVASIAICGLPAWFTYQAVQFQIAPTWAYAAAGALAAVGVLMTVSFLSKAFSGVSTSRERRHR
ncbi:hypothetical protein TR2A62_1176 [Thalassobium sp. R2A62]|nr:hypothetical protein TR2A62_1176 [Thalassobium sp. R2A62]